MELSSTIKLCCLRKGLSLKCWVAEISSALMLLSATRNGQYVARTTNYNNGNLYFLSSLRSSSTMGNDTSLPLAPVSPGFSTMCISLQYSDTITVLHHDSGALSTIRQAIIDTWPNGVQREMAICGTGWGFKVKGNA